MTQDRKVEVVKKETPFQGYFRVDRYHLRHSQFQGGMGNVVSREIFERGHAAGIIPYDPVRDEVVLIEQFRPGAFAAGDPDPWMIEVVAGIVDEGETPEDVARRESVEEAGVILDNLHPIGRFYMTPGGSSESITLFVGQCDASKAGGIHGLDEEGEDIRVFTEPFDTAHRMVLNNRINNAMTAMAVLLLASCRETLRKEWA
ncbi:NUDIX domain-containing protein [Rhodospirillaceae bacterium KN72]|uniref:ADP-ribose pyrophosphatase n=1 Tax=Pacificispira spongiicola TaxID=2729598 RepID=A0A7Y0DYS8_9PROT|nr:NUDIX domain-containing protein [Pacificispira spongiicola]NMM44070.1 NUDIX domain-containing protein [Pacificispira spongiicola]